MAPDRDVIIYIPGKKSESDGNGGGGCLAIAAIVIVAIVLVIWVLKQVLTVVAYVAFVVLVPVWLPYGPLFDVDGTGWIVLGAIGITIVEMIWLTVLRALLLRSDWLADHDYVRLLLLYLLAGPGFALSMIFGGADWLLDT
jgi:hypothetical protein